MMRFIKRLCTWKLIPVSWTLLTVILLCLPGSTIPNEGLFDTEGIDKVVHFILFGGIVFLWAFHLYFRRGEKLQWRRIIVLLTVLSIALGIGLEFLQLYYIPNRSFDGMDIMADSTGALAAGIFHWLKKVK
jgi:hypothetical protein